eukprot:SAG22_NODE_1403_length_4492_cov_13.784430_3_plen_776_part_01
MEADGANDRDAQLAAMGDLAPGCLGCLMGSEGDITACGLDGLDECHASCGESDPESCDQFREWIGEGGCAETCPDVMGAEWVEGATANFCGGGNSTHGACSVDGDCDQEQSEFCDGNVCRAQSCGSDADCTYYDSQHCDGGQCAWYYWIGAAPGAEPAPEPQSEPQGACSVDGDCDQEQSEFCDGNVCRAQSCESSADCTHYTWQYCNDGECAWHWWSGAAPVAEPLAPAPPSAEPAPVWESETCAIEDAECMTAPRVDVCVWPDWQGENTDGVVCNQTSGGWGGCSNQDQGCQYESSRTCDFEPSGDCAACFAAQRDDAGELGFMSCMVPVIPEAAFCPDGTTLTNATTPAIGECKHECQSHDAWQPDHVCYELVSTGRYDWSNNTCGIGDCDRHSTPEACEADNGYWRHEEMFSEQPCSSIQGLMSWMSYSSARSGDSSMDYYFMQVQGLVMAGGTCCSGFDPEAFMGCTSDDITVFTTIENSDGAEREAAIAALAPGCLACLMDSDGDMSSCLSEEALADMAGMTCTIEDAECMAAPRVDVCVWPEWRGENTDSVVCEQTSEGWGGCDNQDQGCHYDQEPTCDFRPTGDCASCMVAAGKGGGMATIMSCMVPVIPVAAFCPEGNTLAPDAITPVIGECKHECQSHDAWQPDHVCYELVSNARYDWSNNTCGIGDCDRHNTPEACEADNGYWRHDEMFSEQPCSTIQGLMSWMSFHAETSDQGSPGASFFAMQALAMVGETCCSGYDPEAFMGCTSDDVPVFTTIENSDGAERE